MPVPDFKLMLRYAPVLMLRYAPVLMLSGTSLLFHGCQKTPELDSSAGNSPASDASDGQPTEGVVEQEQDESESNGQIIDLMDDEHLANWQAAKFGGQGPTKISREKFELGFGYNMTGVVYTGELPTNLYNVSYEARKTQGSDFFGTLTFPVNDSHCSLVLGGWAGATVGISSIDNEDASQNETKMLMGFKDEQWYRVTVEVNYPSIKCWIDDEQVISVDVSGKKVHVRGDVEVCRPLGFCSFETEAEIRNVKLVELNGQGHATSDNK